MTTLPLPVKRYKRYTTKVRGGQLVDIHGLVSRGSAADLEHLAQQLDRDKGGRDVRCRKKNRSVYHQGVTSL